MPDWRVMTPSGATTEDEDMEDDELAEEPVIVSKNLAKKRHVVQSPRKKPPISSIGVAKAPKKVKQKATFQRQVSMKSVETPDVSRVSIESHASTAIASTSTTSTLVSSTGALSAASEGEEWISSHLPAKATSSPRQTSIAASSDDRIIFIDDKGQTKCDHRAAYHALSRMARADRRGGANNGPTQQSVRDGRDSSTTIPRGCTASEFVCRTICNFISCLITGRNRIACAVCGPRAPPTTKVQAGHRGGVRRRYGGYGQGASSEMASYSDTDNALTHGVM